MKTKIISIIAIVLMTMLVFSSCTTKSNDVIEETETYDWGTLAPGKEEDNTEYEFSFNKYAISSYSKYGTSDTFTDSYNKVVDAIEERRESVTIPVEDKNAVVTALFDSYPLSVLLTQISAVEVQIPIETESETVKIVETTIPEDAVVETTPETVDVVETSEEPIETVIETKTMIDMYFSYKYERETHMQVIKQFYNSVAKIITGTLKNSMSDFEKVLALYSWTAQNIEDSSSNRISVFDVLFTAGEKTISEEQVYSENGATHAGVLQFLALQAGFESSVVKSPIRTSSHMWCTIAVNGKSYYFDPAYEYTDSMGSGLMFFGLTDVTYIEGGFAIPFTFGNRWNVTTELYNAEFSYYPYTIECYDTTFSTLKDCNYYTITNGVLEFYHSTTGESDTLNIKEIA